MALSWLHFSDLHLNSARHGSNSTRVLNTLLDDFEKMADELGGLDLLFCTGDLVYGEGVAGLSIDQQFEQAFDWFETLLARLTLQRGKKS